MHSVTSSIISVKFWEIKEDIGISAKCTTSHFRISYRSRDICLDWGSFINLSDEIVSKRVGSTQTSIFSPNTVFHSRGGGGECHICVIRRRAAGQGILFGPSNPRQGVFFRA